MDDEGVIPDESVICRFRHLFEKRGLSVKVLRLVNDHLAAHGLVLKEDTIVDATIIQAPSYTLIQSKDFIN